MKIASLIVKIVDVLFLIDNKKKHNFLRQLTALFIMCISVMVIGISLPILLNWTEKINKINWVTCSLIITYLHFRLLWLGFKENSITHKSD